MPVAHPVCRRTNLEWIACQQRKLVMTVDRPLADIRAELTAKGVRMGQIKSHAPLTELSLAFARGWSLS